MRRATPSLADLPAPPHGNRVRIGEARGMPWIQLPSRRSQAFLQVRIGFTLLNACFVAWAIAVLCGWPPARAQLQALVPGLPSEPLSHLSWIGSLMVAIGLRWWWLSRKAPPVGAVVLEPIGWSVFRGLGFSCHMYPAFLCPAAEVEHLGLRAGEGPLVAHLRGTYVTITSAGTPTDRRWLGNALRQAYRLRPGGTSPTSPPAPAERQFRKSRAVDGRLTVGICPPMGHLAMLLVLDGLLGYGLALVLGWAPAALPDWTAWLAVVLAPLTIGFVGATLALLCLTVWGNIAWIGRNRVTVQPWRVVPLPKVHMRDGAVEVAADARHNPIRRTVHLVSGRARYPIYAAEAPDAEAFAARLIAESGWPRADGADLDAEA